MATRAQEHRRLPLGRSDEEVEPLEIDDGLDDPEELDVDELEDDDGWPEDDDA